MRRRTATILTIAVVVLALGSLIGLATYSPSETPSVISRTPPTTTPSHPPQSRAVFIGDSYTQGFGASTEALKWTSLVAEAKNWEEVNLGLGGTGYVATSGVKGCGQVYCANFREVAEEAAAEDPDIVVVAGGRNDLVIFASDRARVTTAMSQTFTRLRKDLPRARIIAVGPAAPGPVDKTVRNFDASVNEIARRSDATFISLIEPQSVITSSMVLDDGVHVNDEGHEAIAQRVLAALG